MMQLVNPTGYCQQDILRTGSSNGLEHAIDFVRSAEQRMSLGRLATALD